jgi:hypothetical protein
MDDSLRLRRLLGEQIPPDKTDADTFFTNAEIDDLLNNHQGPKGDNFYSAVAEGWERKAGAYADLVNTTHGGAQRAMSDLSAHAERRLEHFHQLAQGRRGTRIGQVKRAGTTLR